MGKAGEKEKQTKKSSTVRETAKKNSMGKAKTAAGILAAAEQIAPTSWFCYIGIRGKKEIPKGYRIFSCLMAVAVFISTLTTKQHVLYDVVSGMLLAELSYALTVKTGFAKKYQSFFEWADKTLHLKQKPERV